MIAADRDLNQALKEYFGFNSFKGNQKEIIQSVLNGKDTFVIMPTGGGKSLCYQLPGIMMEGTAIIISPLIALMKNQVDQVRGYSSNENVAHFLNSSLNKTQKTKVKKDIVSGETKLLYVAPETLGKEDTIEFFKAIKISFIAVDEAHCISEWGHDFRPEYRRIRNMITELEQDIPIIALTATATPKVRADIMKNLKMDNPRIFISTFLRDNLYYEIRPKGKKSHAIKDLVTFIKKNQGKSGIIYCLNRKTTEELADTLNVNGISAAPYHAGLEAQLRSRTQDQFLMEEINVIVATIAFGMGIDKPDVRFVIHYNIPKSLENYYQETGRAGRDGLEGKCIAYYTYKDVEKLEKFLRDKPVAEREIGHQHLMEISAYAESAACRRKFLLHYFGEEYDTSQCGNGECDNCKHPKEQIKVKKEVRDALRVIAQLNGDRPLPHLIDLITGKDSAQIRSYGHEKLDVFGIGKDHDERFWSSLLRTAMLENLIYKDIESYGLIKLTEKGEAYIEKPYEISIALNTNFIAMEEADEESDKKGGALDTQLLGMLKSLRKKVAKEKNLPPFVIFQDPSLEDMATQYPISMDELANITGVSRGKALKYGRKFIELIARYVEENDIDRPSELTVKSIVQKSGLKVYIIQNIDRKIPLEVIAGNKGLSRDELFKELESIVASGTKIDINYYIDDLLEEDIQDMIYDYFSTAESDSLDLAFQELQDEGITMEEIQVMRLKFMSEMAN